MHIIACEEVVDVDLRNAEPKLNVEAVIFRDSVCNVRLTMTTDYFSELEPQVVDDAVIKINDENTSEILHYKGNGNYSGSTILGTSGVTYAIEILHDGVTYTGTSTMPGVPEIRSTRYSKSTEVSILNPEGETVYTINCRFYDDPSVSNYYMICYRSRWTLIEQRFFMLTESSANGGSFDKTGDLISFSESIFWDGGIVDVQLYSLDEPVYQYFKQLDDILFWKRRYIPPVPYNPKSNLSGGALGYFAAMSYDSSTLVLE
jgi:hypothetical protein